MQGDLLERQIRTVVDRFAKELPQRINQHATIFGIEKAQKTIFLYVQVSDAAVKILKENFDKERESVLNAACKNEVLGPLIYDGARVEYQYLDQESSEVARVLVTTGACGPRGK